MRRTANTLTLGVLLIGCASAPDTGPGPSPPSVPIADGAAVDSALAPLGDAACRREATIAVRVKNQSSLDIKVAFGSYRPARVAAGFSQTTYQVARYHLRSSIRLEILRGGVQVGGPAIIQTEPVFCNIATLIIGSRPQSSIFYGDELFEPVRGSKGEEENEDEAMPQTPADSAASEAHPTTPA